MDNEEERNPESEYTKLANTFNPVNFGPLNGRQLQGCWNEVYGHHFKHQWICLFDSKVSDYNVVKATAKRYYQRVRAGM